MNNQILWELPFPSTALCGDVVMIHPGATAWMVFSYCDIKNVSAAYNSGLKFKHVQAFRFSCEPFATLSALDAYDKIIEIESSEWIQQLKAINAKVCDFWGLRHFGIYLDSNGFYEFLASEFEVLETKNGEFEWTQDFISEISS